MKGKKLLTLFAAVVAITAAMCFAVACGGEAKDKGKDEAKTYTVRFDTDGAGDIKPVGVKSGETVAEPTEPQKPNFVFKGWFEGDTAYDFSTPVTGNVTLKAKWNELYTVTFKSGDDTFKTVSAENGTPVAMSEVPSKANNIFMYWSADEQADGAKYDFSAPITSDLTLHAKWISIDELSGMLSEALEPKKFSTYPYTAVFTVSELYDGEIVEYSITYKLFENAEGGHDVYSKFDSDWATEERYTVFGADGKELCRYFKKGDAWSISESVWSYDYYMPFEFGDMSTDWDTGAFSCVDGAVVDDGAYVFHVYDEEMANFEYGLLGSLRGDLIRTARFYVKDDALEKVCGKMQNDCDYVVAFDRADFSQARPTLPQSVVTANKVKDLSGIAGKTLSLSDITAMFELKVNGNTVGIAEDMLDLGGLDLQAPAVGDYTVTLDYTAWDGAKGTARSTVKISSQTLGDLLGGKAYLNSSFTVGSETITHSGDVYSYSDSSFGYYLKLDDSTQGYKTAKMAKITKNVTLNPWVRCVRIDLLLDLAADLFTYDEAAKTYSLTPNYGSKPYKTELQRFFALTNTTSTLYSLVKLEDQTKPYSLVVTVDGNTITKISVSYYTTKNIAFEFAVADGVAAVETPHEVLNAFTQYTVTYKSGEGAQGEDKVETANGGSYAVLRYSESSFAWTVNAGMKFVDWVIEGTDTHVNGGSTYKLDSMDDASVTFVAQWAQLAKYTVTYKAGEHGVGADVVESDVYEGKYALKNISALSMAAQDGYEFAGWLAEGGSAALNAGDNYDLTANVVFVAQWKQAFTSGVVYRQAEDGKEQAKLYDGSQYIVLDELEVDIAGLQVKLTYTKGGESATAVLDMQVDKYYGKDYQLQADGELKNYFANGVFIKFSSDNGSLQVSEYDDYDEVAVDIGSAFMKQA